MFELIFEFFHHVDHHRTMATTPRLTYPMLSMSSLMCVGVAWRVFYHSRAFNLPFNGGRSGCFIETSRGRFSVCLGLLLHLPGPADRLPASLHSYSSIGWIGVSIGCLGCGAAAWNGHLRLANGFLWQYNTRDINDLLAIWVITMVGIQHSTILEDWVWLVICLRVDWARDDQRNE